MADDDGFISLPPGLIDADSGTHRRPRAERTERIPADEIVFVPVVPGAPPAVTLPAPATDDAQPTENNEVNEDNDETRIIPSRVTRSWRLTIPGIEGPIVVEGALFLGRNPASTEQHPGAELLAIPDPSKSISKTHALIEVDGGLWVHDLDSTNGVWIVSPGQDPVEVTPGTRAAVIPGADLELGDVTIQVELS